MSQKIFLFSSPFYYELEYILEVNVTVSVLADPSVTSPFATKALVSSVPAVGVPPSALVA